MTTAGRLRASGKVRDIYDAGPDRLLMVASDRVSAFDVVLPTQIPDKGRVLTGLSLFWFERTADLVANHLLSADPADLGDGSGEADLPGRAMLVRRAQVIPIECVARGYITGSGWSQYREEQAVCGIPLPAGLVESERLPEPIFTPTTKAEEGHDMPLTPSETEGLIGEGLAQRLKELTLTIYGRAADVARERGIILADTKFEFGFIDGEIALIDEVCTPDSSRFWPLDRYAAGHGQPSYDKQYVRDWLDASGWDHEPPPPELPDDVVDATAGRYREAYERIVGEPFAKYLERMGIA
ncbi:MAG: phosphoribosylaminoimidazolesuccinocarboxamide synthase [Actinomycetota bacterium]